MVLVSAADGDMTDPELAAIGEIVRTLPVFRDCNAELLTTASEDCANLLGEDDGLETVLAIIARSLPASLHETAYVVACEVTAADLVGHQEELRLLEMLRFGLNIDRLAAAAIERATRARHATA